MSRFAYIYEDPDYDVTDNWDDEYEQRVQKYQIQGMTRSDAQAVVDSEIIWENSYDNG